MSEGKLPEGWVNTEIGDIAEIISGGTPKSGNASNFAPTGEGIAWLTPADLSGYKKKCIARGARDLSIDGYSSCSAKLMQAGAILFSSRAPIGYVAVASNEIATNQGFKSFVFTDDIYTDYAYYYLRNIRHLAEEKGTGTTFKEISGSSAKTLPFVIAPLAEQKIIAEKLDTLLAQVDSTKARLEQIPKILKRFRQAVLASAVNGILTKEYRSNEIFGAQISLGELILNGPQNGLYKPSRFYGDGIKIIRIDSFYDGKILNFNELKRLDVTDIEKNKWLLQENDILINRVNSIEYLGKCAHVKNISEEAVFESNIMRFSIDTMMISPEYLILFLCSTAGIKELRKNAKLAVNQASINQTDIKNCKLTLPALAEQNEIVRRVEQLFAYADTIEKQVNNALVRVNNLTQSILAKAFRGELTAQWRAENPELISGENSAAALLEKIKAERAASTGKKASRKKS